MENEPLKWQTRQKGRKGSDEEKNFVRDREKWPSGGLLYYKTTIYFTFRFDNWVAAFLAAGRL